MGSHPDNVGEKLVTIDARVVNETQATILYLIRKEDKFEALQLLRRHVKSHLGSVESIEKMDAAGQAALEQAFSWLGVILERIQKLKGINDFNITTEINPENQISYVDLKRIILMPGEVRDISFLIDKKMPPLPKDPRGRKAKL